MKLKRRLQEIKKKKEENSESERRNNRESEIFTQYLSLGRQIFSHKMRAFYAFTILTTPTYMFYN